MIIKINGDTVNFSLESEKTVSDIIYSIEQWLTGSGHRMSGFSVNGKTIDSSSVENFLSMEIDSIKNLDISTSSIADLAAESLLTILDNINELQSLKPEDKKAYIENWNNTPQANFVKESMPDLYEMLINSFNGNGLNLNGIFSVTEERLREIKSPKDELEKLKPLLDETCTRLTDLSLDVQTGKDARASQTIQLFSGITEKLLRIANQLELQGLLAKTIDEPLKKIVNELGNVIKELLSAYTRNDTVLVGDLAEYEACVKLQEFYNELRGDK